MNDITIGIAMLLVLIAGLLFLAAVAAVAVRIVRRVERWLDARERLAAHKQLERNRQAAVGRFHAADETSRRSSRLAPLPSARNPTGER